MKTKFPKQNFRFYSILAVSLIGIMSLSGYMLAEAKSPVVTGLKLEGAPDSVVFIADPHLQEKNLDHIRNAIGIINKMNPSVVLIGGDFVNGDEEDFSLHDVWKEIDAPVYAVLGNHDYQSGIHGINGQYKMLDVAIKANTTVEGYDVSALRDENTNLEFASGLEARLEESGVNVLKNEYVIINAGGKELMIVGLDDGWAGLSNPPELPETDAYTIYMIHEPECRADWDADLILSGHTHGGQFAPPFIQLLNDNGILELSGYFDSGTPLYITRGIGSSSLFGIELRYQSQPEIVVINPR
ncbi:metallophosphoesterase [Methanoplanus sp. FWC-SCC4]|uniref:Metallophosphoesterase n=1 Tax=Methanochimaera problematica TaxID=2609417 RepID=A0AA97FBN8_9EURY|nr:metallophosphoesterase [Methanoplanus sp. FWC-SCC4]WOF16480.1 metallophosphoesterase [Methanoplanus sp. FWC-SCC4]